MMSTINRIRIGNIIYDVGHLTAEDKSIIEFEKGWNYVENKLVIPMDKHFVVCDVSNGGSMRFNGQLKIGQSLKILLRNKTPSTIQVNLPQSQGGKSNVFLTEKKSITLNRWTLIYVTCFETNGYIIDYKQQIY